MNYAAERKLAAYEQSIIALKQSLIALRPLLTKEQKAGIDSVIIKLEQLRLA